MEQRGEDVQRVSEECKGSARRGRVRRQRVSGGGCKEPTGTERQGASGERSARRRRARGQWEGTCKVPVGRGRAKGPRGVTKNRRGAAEEEEKEEEEEEEEEGEELRMRGGGERRRLAKS